jgi:hypothetical protein
MDPFIFFPEHLFHKIETITLSATFRKQNARRQQSGWPLLFRASARSNAAFSTRRTDSPFRITRTEMKRHSAERTAREGSKEAGHRWKRWLSWRGWISASSAPRNRMATHENQANPLWSDSAFSLSDLILYPTMIFSLKSFINRNSICEEER